ncbi:MAG: hypothetical protein QQN60_07235, partial [Nitrosopumilus sp.]
MKKCKVCGIEVAEQYDYCLKCINKVKETNLMHDVLKKLEHLNWNAGASQKWLKWSLLSQLSTAKSSGGGLTPTQQKMMDFLENEFKKDMNAVKKIKEE